VALHRVRIIEQGDLSTHRLFELSLGLATCRKMGKWPSLQTVNSLLSRGTDDGNLGTDIEWEPFEMTEPEYLALVRELMAAKQYTVDDSRLHWDEWFDGLAKS
jgi:hypothetical protein